MATSGILPPPPTGNGDLNSDTWQDYFVLQQKVINSVSSSNNSLGTLASQNANTVSITGGSLSGVSIDCTTLQCNSLRIDATPLVAAIGTSTHKVAISLNGTTYYILLSDV